MKVKNIETCEEDNLSLGRECKELSQKHEKLSRRTSICIAWNASTHMNIGYSYVRLLQLPV
jgi:hypothetical protein